MFRVQLRVLVCLVALPPSLSLAGKAAENTEELVAVRDGAEGTTIEIAPGTFELDAPLQPQACMTLRPESGDRIAATG